MNSTFFSEVESNDCSQNSQHSFLFYRGKYKGSYINAHVLFIYLTSWGKRENARLAEHFISFSQRVK